MPTSVHECRLYLSLGYMGTANCEYQDVKNILLVDDPPSEKDMDEPVFQKYFKKMSALYMRIHSRFVVSRTGLEILRGKVLL